MEQASLWKCFCEKEEFVGKAERNSKKFGHLPFNFLIELEKKLQKELLDQERDLWAMKSRIN